VLQSCLFRSSFPNKFSRHFSSLSCMDDPKSANYEDSHNEFNVHGSVHRESMSIIDQQDATVCSLLYFCKLLYMFRVVTPPIIRSTCNFNYSIWHWSNFGKYSVWSQLKMRGTDPSPLPSAIIGSRKVAETVGSIPLIFSWLHTLHFPKFDKCQML